MHERLPDGLQEDDEQRVSGNSGDGTVEGEVGLDVTDRIPWDASSRLTIVASSATCSGPARAAARAATPARRSSGTSLSSVSETSPIRTIRSTAE